MEASILIEAIAGLVVILGLLIFIMLKPKVDLTTKKEYVTPSEPKKKTDLDSIRHVIRNRTSTKEELAEAVDMVLKYHKNIPEKLGVRINPKFDAYMEIFVTLCRHKNATKDMILKLDKELVKNNPDYKSEINDSITKGLNSRR
ncbi:hypothetical protein [Sulfurimonas sp.]|uniref:hypothetical protein n=1 Tax=Sulfurimonas sp. TaxID=2022749 RepID=UPI00356A27B8